MNLLILLIAPLLTSLLILFAGKKELIRYVSLAGTAAQLIISSVLCYLYLKTGNTEQFAFSQTLEWFPQHHIQFSMGVDGISVAMILLTAFVSIAGVLISWNIEDKVKEFYFLLSMLSLGAYGFFISLDLFVIFFFLELAVIPKYLLIGIWGSGKKEYSANKLALMLMGGSALILISLLVLYFNFYNADHQHSFSLLEIAKTGIDVDLQYVLFPLLFAGFGVFTAMFPFHTWAPDGHSSAPTAASMFLAGISMKLGGYGCLRVATYLMPEAAHHYSWAVVAVATIAILYGSFATMMQKDMKYINAYSSVSHCGYVLLGIGMLTKTAIIGAVMQMVSHGIMTALFFGAIGMIYQRTHTRNVDELGGLLKTIPFIGTVYIIAGLCSLGLPGFSGFVAEMTVFMGSFQNTDPYLRIATILSCMAIVVTAVYIMRAIGKVVLGPVKNESFLLFKDAAWTEKLASVVLILVIVFIGTLPFWLNHLIEKDVTVILTKLSGI